VAVAEAACLATKDFISTLHQLRADIPDLPLKLLQRRLERIERAVAVRELEGIQDGWHVQMQHGDVQEQVAGVASSSSSGNTEDTSRQGGESAWNLGKGLAEVYVNEELKPCYSSAANKTISEQQQGNGVHVQLVKMQRRDQEWFACYKPVACALTQMRQVAGLPPRILGEMNALEKAEAAAALHELKALGLFEDQGDQGEQKALMHLWYTLVANRVKPLLESLQLWQLQMQQQAAKGMQELQGVQSKFWDSGNGKGQDRVILEQLVGCLEQNQQVYQQRPPVCGQQRSQEHQQLQSAWRKEAQRVLDAGINDDEGLDLAGIGREWRAAVVAAPGKLLTGSAAVWGEAQLLLELVPLLWPSGVLPVAALVLTGYGLAAFWGVVPAIRWLLCCQRAVLEGFSLSAADAVSGQNEISDEELTEKRYQYYGVATKRWGKLHADADALHLLTERLRTKQLDVKKCMQLLEVRTQWFSSLWKKSTEACAVMQLWAEREASLGDPSRGSTSNSSWSPHADVELNIKVVKLSQSLAEDLLLALKDLTTQLPLLEKVFQAGHIGYLEAKKHGEGKLSRDREVQQQQQRQGLAVVQMSSIELLQEPGAAARVHLGNCSAVCLETIMQLEQEVTASAAATARGRLDPMAAAVQRQKVLLGAEAVKEAWKKLQSARASATEAAAVCSQLINHSFLESHSEEITEQSVDALLTTARLQAAILAGQSTSAARAEVELQAVGKGRQSELNTAGRGSGVLRLAAVHGKPEKQQLTLDSWAREAGWGMRGDDVPFSARPQTSGTDSSTASSTSWYQEYVPVGLLLKKLARSSNLPGVLYGEVRSLWHAEAVVCCHAAEVVADHGGSSHTYSTLMQHLVLHQAVKLLEHLQQHQQQCQEQLLHGPGHCDWQHQQQLSLQALAQDEKQQQEEEGESAAGPADLLEELIVHLNANQEKCHGPAQQEMNAQRGVFQKWWRNEAIAVSERLLQSKVWGVSAFWDESAQALGSKGPRKLPKLAKLWAWSLDLLSLVPVLWVDEVPLLAHGLLVVVELFNMGPGVAGAYLLNDQDTVLAPLQAAASKREAGVHAGRGRGSGSSMQALPGDEARESCQAEQQHADFCLRVLAGKLIDKRMREQLPPSDLILRDELLRGAAAGRVPKCALPVMLLEHWQTYEPLTPSSAAAVAAADGGGAWGEVQGGSNGSSLESKGGWDPCKHAIFMREYSNLSEDLANEVQLIVGAVLQQLGDAQGEEQWTQLGQPAVQQKLELMGSFWGRTATDLERWAAAEGPGTGQGRFGAQKLLKFIQLGQVSLGPLNAGSGSLAQQASLPQRGLQQEDDDSTIAAGCTGGETPAASAAPKGVRASAESGSPARVGLKKGFFAGKLGNVVEGAQGCQQQGQMGQCQSGAEANLWYAQPYQPIAADLKKWLVSSDDTSKKLQGRVATLSAAEKDLDKAAKNLLNTDPRYLQLLQHWIVFESGELHECILGWEQELKDKYLDQLQQGMKPGATAAAAAVQEQFLQGLRQACELLLTSLERWDLAAADEQMLQNRIAYRNWWREKSEGLLSVLAAKRDPSRTVNIEAALPVAIKFFKFVTLLWPNKDYNLRVVVLGASISVERKKVLGAADYLHNNKGLVAAGLKSADALLNKLLSEGVSTTAAVKELLPCVSRAGRLFEQFQLEYDAWVCIRGRKNSEEGLLPCRDTWLCKAEQQGVLVSKAVLDLMRLWAHREPSAAAAVPTAAAPADVAPPTTAAAQGQAWRDVRVLEGASSKGQPPAASPCSPLAAASPSKTAGVLGGDSVGAKTKVLSWDPCNDLEFKEAYQSATHELGTLLHNLLSELTLLLSPVESGHIEEQPEHLGLAAPACRSTSSALHHSHTVGSSSGSSIAKESRQASSGTHVLADTAAGTTAPSAQGPGAQYEGSGLGEPRVTGSNHSPTSSSSSLAEGWEGSQRSADLLPSPAAIDSSNARAWDVERTQKYGEKLLNLLAPQLLYHLLEQKQAPVAKLQRLIEAARYVHQFASNCQMSAAGQALKVLEGIAGLSSTDLEELHQGDAAALFDRLYALQEAVPVTEAEEQLRVEEEGKVWDDLFGNGCGREGVEAELAFLDGLICRMLDLYWKLVGSERQPSAQWEQDVTESQAKDQMVPGEPACKKTNSGSSRGSDAPCSDTSFGSMEARGHPCLNINGVEGQGEPLVSSALQQRRKRQHSLWKQQRCKQQEHHALADAPVVLLAASGTQKGPCDDDDDDGDDDSSDGSLRTSAPGYGKLNLSRGWGENCLGALDGGDKGEGLAAFWRAHGFLEDDTEGGDLMDGAVEEDDSKAGSSSPAGLQSCLLTESMISGSCSDACNGKLSLGGPGQSDVLDQWRGGIDIDTEARKLCLARSSSSRGSTLNRTLLPHQDQTKDQQQQAKKQQGPRQQPNGSQVAPSGSAIAAAGGSSRPKGALPAQPVTAARDALGGLVGRDEKDAVAGTLNVGCIQYKQAAAVARCLLEVWQALVKMTTGVERMRSFYAKGKEQKEKLKQLLSVNADNEKLQPIHDLAASYKDQWEQEWKSITRYLSAVAVARHRLRESLGVVASNVPILASEKQLKSWKQLLQELQGVNGEAADGSNLRRGSCNSSSSSDSSLSSARTVLYKACSDDEDSDSSRATCGSSSSDSESTGGDDTEESSCESGGGGSVTSSTQMVGKQQEVKWEWTGVGVLSIDDGLQCDVVRGPLGAAIPQVLLRGLTVANSSQLPEVLKEMVEAKWEPQRWKRQEVDPCLQQLVHEEFHLGDAQLRGCEVAALQLLQHARLLQETWGVPAAALNEGTPWVVEVVPVGLQSLLESQGKLPLKDREKVGGKGDTCAQQLSMF
jgi:hypothetical protein